MSLRPSAAPRPSGIPAVTGLSPMEASSLAHAEAQFIGKRVAMLGLADGRNLLLEVSMASRAATDNWIAARCSLGGPGVVLRAEFDDCEVATDLDTTTLPAGTPGPGSLGWAHAVDRRPAARSRLRAPGGTAARAVTDQASGNISWPATLRSVFEAIWCHPAAPAPVVRSAESLPARRCGPPAGPVLPSSEGGSTPT